MNARKLVLTLLTGSTLAVLAPAVPSLASPQRAIARHHLPGVIPGAYELIKGEDEAGYVNSGVKSIGLAAQAQADGFALPQFAHILCGKWTAPDGTVLTLGQSDDTNCSQWGAQATPLFENNASLQGTSAWRRASPLRQAQIMNATYKTEFASLVRAVTAGLAPGSTAMYDIESWAYSIPDNGNAPSAIRQACTYAAAHGINLIVSPGGALNTENNVDVAIESQCFAVSIQSQSFGTANFAAKLTAYVNSALATRLDYGSATQIWFGLGTNTATPNTGLTLYNEYLKGQSLGLSNVWLNAANWGLKNQCTASMGGPGCPQYALYYLHDLGIVPLP